MSVWPAQNFLKPPPVPDSWTSTVTAELAVRNPSAIAFESGMTVLEPSMTIRPDGAADSSATGGFSLWQAMTRPGRPIRTRCDLLRNADGVMLILLD